MLWAYGLIFDAGENVKVMLCFAFSNLSEDGKIESQVTSQPELDNGSISFDTIGEEGVHEIVISVAFFLLNAERTIWS